MLLGCLTLFGVDELVCDYGVLELSFVGSLGEMAALIER
jgi:hypothetical protein